jgi:hypothetical protein
MLTNESREEELIPLLTRNNNFDLRRGGSHSIRLDINIHPAMQLHKILEGCVVCDTPVEPLDIAVMRGYP